MTTMDNLSLRRKVIDAALAMNDLGINKGTSGNVSARTLQGFLVTPSGMRYEDLQTGDVVEMDRFGDPIKMRGKTRKPSSEWRFHLDIYAARPEIQAIIHTHSPFSTTLACQHMEIPAFHYMVAAAGGSNIRCAPYATFGTQELSDYAVTALRERFACLLGNHGLIATGPDLEKALALAVEVEGLAEQYWRVLQTGKPRILDDDEMARVIEKFKFYGIHGQKKEADEDEAERLAPKSRPTIALPRRPETPKEKYK